MKISRRSPRTGETNTRKIDITQGQLDQWLARQGHIQDIMPRVSAEDREFIMTGYTPEDWAAMFPPEEEENLECQYIDDPDECEGVQEVYSSVGE